MKRETAAEAFAFTCQLLFLVGLIVLCCALCGTFAAAATYPIRAVGQKSLGEASAVCVGKSRTHSLFVTCKHAVTREVWVANGKRWIKADRVLAARDDDLAAFTVANLDFARSDLLCDVPTGQRVRVCGYFDTPNPCFEAVTSGKGRLSSGRASVRQGDSGGAVQIEHCGRKYVAGVVVGFTSDAQTVYVPAHTIEQFLVRNYRYPYCDRWGRCYPAPPNGGYRRYTKIDPRLFGPPKVLDIIEKTPETPKGPVSPRPVDPEEIRAVVDAWMEQNRESLVGEQGPPGTPGTSGNVDLDELAKMLAERYADALRGPPGRDGQDGTPGTPGRDGIGDTAAMARLNRRVTDLENHTRHVVLQKNGETIDETWLSLDDPLILDIQKIAD